MTRRSGSCFRCCLVILAVISALCVSGPTLYWKLKRGFNLKHSSSISCTPCICDCPPPQSLLKLAPEFAERRGGVGGSALCMVEASQSVIGRSLLPFNNLEP